MNTPTATTTPKHVATLEAIRTLTASEIDTVSGGDIHVVTVVDKSSPPTILLGTDSKHFPT
jgi:hypothetical protein